jgi:Zn-finger nucleic acid-binding protein
VVCAYCGSRLDVDLQGWARYASSGRREDWQCPDGHGALEDIRLGEPHASVDLGRCATCRGLFLDRGGLEHLLDQAVGTVWEVDRRLLNALVEHPRAEAETLRYRPCPCCGDLMNRQLFGKRSGVIIDRCRDHGTWLDAGELRQLLEWRRAGGRILHLQREEERSREEEKRRVREREAAAERMASLQATTDPRDLEAAGDDLDGWEDDLLLRLGRNLRRLLR